MPGGLGRSSSFHSDLNGGWRNLSRWEMEGALCVCVCVCTQLFSFHIPDWKVIADYLPWLTEVRELRGLPCSTPLRKSHCIYHASLRCVADQECNNGHSFWIPFLKEHTHTHFY